MCRRNVLAIFGELDAEALERAAMEADRKSFDYRAGLEPRACEARDDRRIENDRRLPSTASVTSRLGGGPFDQLVADRVGVDALRLGVEVRHMRWRRIGFAALGCP